MTNDEHLRGIVLDLLAQAASAWSCEAWDAAERLTAGAWRLIDGRDFIDHDKKADR